MNLRSTSTSLLFLVAVATAQAPGPSPSPRVDFASMPMALVPNEGQWPGHVSFFGRRGCCSVWFTDRGWVLSATGVLPGTRAPREHGATAPRPQPRAHVVRMELEGAAGGTPGGLDRAPGFHRVHAERCAGGNSGAAYARFVTRDFLPDVDLEVRADDAFFAYDLRVGAGVALDGVRIRCDGVDRLGVDAKGRLVMDTPLGQWRQTAPVAWYERPDGGRAPVAVRFRMIDACRFGFERIGPARDLPLVVDPGLRWSTYVGSSAAEVARAVVYDEATKLVTVGGNANSALFPATIGSHTAVQDAFVLCFDPAQSGAAQLRWSHVFGGVEPDFVFDLALGLRGEVWACGLTKSPTFPTSVANLNKPPLQPQIAPPPVGGSQPRTDAFLAELDGAGNLGYSTFLGGAGHDYASSLAVDLTGALVVAGTTSSPTDFPTTPMTAPQPAYGGGSADVFLAWVDPTVPPARQLRWATYWGGTGREGKPYTSTVNTLELMAPNIVLDGLTIGLAGFTKSLGLFTTPNAVQRVHASGGISPDMFLSVFNLTRIGGQMVTYSTFYGGGGLDWPLAIASHPEGGYVLGGYTYSTNFPVTANAYQSAFSGGTRNDGTLVWIDPNRANQVRYATYLGGPSSWDPVECITIDASGRAKLGGTVDVGGQVLTGSFPPVTAGAIQATHAGGAVQLMMHTELDGSAPEYCTLLGGTNSVAFDVVLTRNGEAIFVGKDNGGLPTTTNTYQSTSAGNVDASVAWLDFLPAGAARTAASTPCGNLPIYLDVNSWPKAGNAGFTVQVHQGPAAQSGALVLGPRTPVLPLSLLPLVVVPLPVTSALGRADLPLPLPATLAPGGQVSLQAVFLRSAACAPSGPFGLSDRLDLTVQ